MRTLRTLARSILWIDRYHGNAVESCLVFYLASQIVERPVIQLVPLAFPNRYPVANITQIFKSNSAAGVFSLHHKLFGNNVVLKFLEAFLLTGKLFKLSLCRLGLLSLQITSAMRKGLTDVFNILTGKLFTIGIRSNIHDAEVNSENIFRFKKVGFVNITNTIKKELFTDIKKFYLTLSVLEQLTLLITHHERHGNSTVNRPNGNQIVCLEIDNSVVVIDRSERSKCPLDFRIKFVRVSNFRYGSYSHLSRKVKRIPNGAVRQFVKIELFERLGLKRLFADPITRFIDGFHRLKQGLGLQIKRFQFQVNNQFHNSYSSTDSNIEQGRRFLCQINQAVSTPIFL